MRLLRLSLNQNRMPVALAKLLLIAALPMAGASCCAGMFGRAPTQSSSALASRAQPSNALCPVCNHAALAAYTVVYQGKTIGFCCEDCEKRFEANPQKYALALK
jgi:YHS domain-containing protein